MSSQGFARMVAPLSRRIRSMISRCVLDSVNAGTKRQTMKVELLSGEVANGVEHFEPYGMTSNPLDGDGVFLSIGANRSHGVSINVGGKTYRLAGLKPGEVALYDDLGNVIALERGQIRVNAVQHADVTAPTCHITAVTTHDGNVTINGNLKVVGNINATGDITDGISSMQDMRGTYNGHAHPENDNGGPTGTPIQGME